MIVKVKPECDSYNSNPEEVEVTINPTVNNVWLSFDSYTPDGDFRRREFRFNLAELKHILSYDDK